jgi:hypothetical protein
MLTGTDVTDADLKALGPLHHLQQLALDRTAVTDAGVALRRNPRSATKLLS